MVNYSALVKHLSVVDDKPFALLSHQTSAVDGILYNAFGTRLKVLLSPEHGWFGIAEPGEKTGDALHPFWGVPVRSLYNTSHKPTPEMLADVGRVVIDLQDIGVRCYTYLATLKLTLETASELHLPVTVLDRPVPLGGILDGPRREIAFSSFVAPLDIPLCHGMTPGECARYIDSIENLGLDLTVIRMTDWNHTVRAPWPNFMPPSPGIPSWDSAALYPATVFTEAYPSLDCDRGGPLSFRVLGAPWLDTAALIDDLAEVLPACGMGLRPYRYRPARGSYAGTLLNGVQLFISNPEAFYPVTSGIVVFAAVLQRHAESLLAGSRPDWLDKLAGSADIRDALKRDALSELFRKWIDQQDEYLEKKVNLYD